MRQVMIVLLGVGVVLAGCGYRWRDPGRVVVERWASGVEPTCVAIDAQGTPVSAPWNCAREHPPRSTASSVRAVRITALCQTPFDVPVREFRGEVALRIHGERAYLGPDVVALRPAIHRGAPVTFAPNTLVEVLRRLPDSAETCDAAAVRVIDDGGAHSAETLEGIFFVRADSLSREPFPGPSVGEYVERVRAEQRGRERASAERVAAERRERIDAELASGQCSPESLGGFQQAVPYIGEQIGMGNRVGLLRPELTLDDHEIRVLRPDGNTLEFVPTIGGTFVFVVASRAENAISSENGRGQPSQLRAPAVEQLLSELAAHVSTSVLHLRSLERGQVRVSGRGCGIVFVLRTW